MFKLVIECSKDIDKLHIDFSDGTCITTAKEDKCNENNKSTNEQQHVEDVIDTSKDYTADKKESIKALDIPDVKDRPAKIDDNLNFLDF